MSPKKFVTIFYMEIFDLVFTDRRKLAVKAIKSMYGWLTFILYEIIQIIHRINLQKRLTI
jgi:hypothetical protein